MIDDRSRHHGGDVIPPPHGGSHSRRRDVEIIALECHRPPSSRQPQGATGPREDGDSSSLLELRCPFPRIERQGQVGADDDPRIHHPLRILDEPISILANPTYLPPCIAHLYDQLWTEARMRQVIAKAVAKGIALEVQAGSDFPKPAFLKLAKSMGAKFSFGSNNFDDKTKDLSRWFQAITLLDLQPADLAAPKLAALPSPAGPATHARQIEAH